MGIYFRENDPSAPFCACGTLCDGVADSQGRRGWCVECQEWASKFGPPEIDPATGQEFRRLLRYDPERERFYEWDPVGDRWAEPAEPSLESLLARIRELPEPYRSEGEALVSATARAAALAVIECAPGKEG